MEVRCGYCHGIYDCGLAPDFNSGFACSVCRAWRSLRELVLGVGLPRGIQAELATRIRAFEGEIRDFAESSGLVCSIRPTVWVPRPPLAGNPPLLIAARPFGPLRGPACPAPIPSPVGSVTSSAGVHTPVELGVKIEAATSKAPPPSPGTEGAPTVGASASVSAEVKTELPSDLGVAPLEELPPDFSGNDVSFPDTSSLPDTEYTYTAPDIGPVAGHPDPSRPDPPPGNFAGGLQPPLETSDLRTHRRTPSLSSGRLSESGGRKTKKKKTNKGRKKRERGQRYWGGRWDGGYQDPRDRYGGGSSRGPPPGAGFITSR